MTKCPKLVHTVKGRERALSYVESLKELESDSEYTYKLFHEFDSKPSDVYVKTSIQPAVFELLLAYVLFEGNEIDEGYGLGQEEIATPILSNLFGVEVLDKEDVNSHEFDLYYVWEKWCSLYEKVSVLDVLKHKEVVKVLTELIPVEQSN
jgi:hypothetical protein